MDLKALGAALHEKLAKELLKRLENPDSLTVGDINQIRQFLKDNNVTALVHSKGPTRELADEIEFDDPTEGVRLRPVRGA
ncbi:MAG: hypothetical protein GY722_02920 [bacterium]|nr:hypothetical protein [bacterium]